MPHLISQNRNIDEWILVKKYAQSRQNKNLILDAFKMRKITFHNVNLARDVLPGG
jgi:hypothetical protein